MKRVLPQESASLQSHREPVMPRQAANDVERPPSPWLQRLAILFCVATLSLLFAYSRSNVAFSRRMIESNGYVHFDATAPSWMRERLGPFGDSVAIWFDTPTQVFFGDDTSPRLVERAAQIASLESIAFTGCPIVDRQLERFRGHRTIKEIRLEQTDVTDRAFDVLSSLPRLQFVALSGTNVTPEGLATFRERHPSVGVAVDSATLAAAAGLGPFIADGRVSLDRGLKLRGTIDADVMAAAMRYPSDELTLEKVDADRHLVPLVEKRRLRRFQLNGGSLDEEFAAALASAERDEFSLSLSDVTLTRAAAKSLAVPTCESASLLRVALEDGALAALVNNTFPGSLSLEDMTVRDISELDAAIVWNLELKQVRLEGSLPLPDRLSIDHMSLDEVTLDAEMLACLAQRIAHLTLNAPIVKGDSEAPWPAGCRAKSISLTTMSLDSREAAALAALPLDHLALRDIDWRDDAIENFTDAHVAHVFVSGLHELTPELAHALSTGDMTALYVSDASDGRVLEEILHMTGLHRLRVWAAGASPAQVSALAELPRLEELELVLEPPLSFPAGFWQELKNEHPHLNTTFLVYEASTERLVPLSLMQ